MYVQKYEIIVLFVTGVSRQPCKASGWVKVKVACDWLHRATSTFTLSVTAQAPPE